MTEVAPVVIFLHYYDGPARSRAARAAVDLLGKSSPARD
jgi:hypothetical protein